MKHVFRKSILIELLFLFDIVFRRAAPDIVCNDRNIVVGVDTSEYISAKYSPSHFILAEVVEIDGRIPVFVQSVSIERSKHNSLFTGLIDERRIW